jgi:hypothetical protein
MKLARRSFRMRRMMLERMMMVVVVDGVFWCT